MDCIIIFKKARSGSGGTEYGNGKFMAKSIRKQLAPKA
jgi:hypothetical protein